MTLGAIEKEYDDTLCVDSESTLNSVEKICTVEITSVGPATVQIEPIVVDVEVY